MAVAIQYSCVLVFCHINLPVILQYFLCCRYMTIQATKDAEERLALEEPDMVVNEGGDDGIMLDKGM
jgi:hypothetical protein